MANVIIPNDTRREDVEYIAKKYGIDTNDPAMREAAEVTAARSREAVEMAQQRRRYF
ncbi:MAG: hypothetical protein Q4C77_04005 [Eubacteriales bacterium]|nr:hypothetical protein [Eubacteriales bacterium]